VRSPQCGIWRVVLVVDVVDVVDVDVDVDVDVEVEVDVDVDVKVDGGVVDPVGTGAAIPVRHGA